MSTNAVDDKNHGAETSNVPQPERAGQVEPLPDLWIEDMSHRSSHRLIAWGKEALRTHKTIDGATDAVVLQLEDDFELREEFLLGCCTHHYPPKDLVWELVYGVLEYILDAQAHGVGIEPNADREAG